MWPPGLCPQLLLVSGGTAVHGSCLSLLPPFFSLCLSVCVCVCVYYTQQQLGEIRLAAHVHTPANMIRCAFLLHKSVT